jgi:predicted DCC family thiol-disulfide oxidoreductase YuxK
MTVGKAQTQKHPTPCTGGQFSLLRGWVGLWLVGRSVVWLASGGLAVGLLAGVAVVLSALVLMGWRQRWTAIALAVINLIMATIAGGGTGPALPTVASVIEPASAILLPLALAWPPPAPFGSVEAMGRTDPGGGWRLPKSWLGTMTALLAVIYLAGGLYLLTAPAWRVGTGLWQPGVATDAAMAGWARAMSWAVLAGWLGFAGIALVAHLRPWVWLVVLLISAIALPLAGWWALALALVVWHLATFDPAWLPAKREAKPERVFYDGHCGLCHRSVRFILAEDQQNLFIVSPLQGRTFEQVIAAGQREQLPDSIVVQKRDGTLLVRSAAVLYVLDRLGGAWRIVSWLGGAIPRPITDAGYRAVATVRNRLFARPSDVCPMMPPGLGEKFEP